MYLKINRSKCKWAACDDAVTIVPSGGSKGTVLTMNGEGAGKLWNQMLDGIELSYKTTSEIPILFRTLIDQKLLLSKNNVLGENKIDEASINKIQLLTHKISNLIPEQVILLTLTAAADAEFGGGAGACGDCL